jgi:type IV secretory pathway TrbD component
MALRVIPIRRSGVRTTTFMGGDRDLVMTAWLVAGLIVVPDLHEVRAWVGGALLLTFCLSILRMMAKADPLMRQVYFRHRRYRTYYPARSTPFRINRNSQAVRYGDPVKRGK